LQNYKTILINNTKTHIYDVYSPENQADKWSNTVKQQ